MNKGQSYIPLKTQLDTGCRRRLQHLLIKLYDLFDKEGEHERGV